MSGTAAFEHQWDDRVMRRGIVVQIRKYLPRWVVEEERGGPGTYAPQWWWWNGTSVADGAVARRIKRWWATSRLAIAGIAA